MAESSEPTPSPRITSRPVYDALERVMARHRRRQQNESSPCPTPSTPRDDDAD